MPTHFDDGVLQALVDGELHVTTASSMRRHLDACAECTGRLKSLREGDDLLQRALAVLDRPLAPIPVDQVIARARREGERSRRSRLRWAAVIALMIGGAGALYALPGSPLRRWIDRLVGGRSPAAETSEVAGTAAGIALPPSDRFRIVFAGTPSSSGSVTIRLTDDSVVQARRLNGTARFVAEIDGLRIESSGAADFTIDLPRAARWVELIAGSRRIFLKDGARIVSEAPPDSLGRYVVTLTSH